MSFDKKRLKTTFLMTLQANIYPRYEMDVLIIGKNSSIFINMDAVMKAELKLKLEKLIEQYIDDIRGMEDMTQPVKPENSLGRISRMDAINTKGLLESSLRNKRNKLNKLRLALQKIDEPSFGLCDNCDKPIQEGRLMFLPESTKCIRCASR